MVPEERLDKIVNKIVSGFKPKKIILFGSYAWGKPSEDSDLDFFVIQKTSEDRLEREVKIRKAIFPAGIPVDIISYTPEEVQKRLERNDSFISRVMTEGKVLYAE